MNNDISEMDLVDDDNNASIWCPTTIHGEASHKYTLKELQKSSQEDQANPLATLIWMKTLFGLNRFEEAISMGLKGCYQCPTEDDFFLGTVELMIARGRCEYAEYLLSTGPDTLREKGGLLAHPGSYSRYAWRTGTGAGMRQEIYRLPWSKKRPSRNLRRLVQAIDDDPGGNSGEPTDVYKIEISPHQV